MKTPQFLRQLMSSSEYMDKNSAAYAMAEKYLNLLYPGTAQPGCHRTYDCARIRYDADAI